jgi:sugar lactone lactonase YvrE
MKTALVNLLGIGVLLAFAPTPLHAQDPTITNQPGSRALWTSGNTSFSVGVAGTGPFTYQWFANGTNLSGGVITTFAGGQLFDGLLATYTILNTPNSVAMDSAGNLFIADMNNNVIRKVSTNGMSQIIAGTGAIAGIGADTSLGDGGLATNACLNQPTAVVLDTNGNLYIADSGNNRVRKLQTNGIITTIAGNGQTYLNGNLNQVGDGGPATNAALALPAGLALDKSGNLFIADNWHQTIRKMDTNGNINTVAGKTGFNGYTGDNIPATTAELTFPSGVAVDATGNLFIADTGNNRIRKVNTSGTITTFAGTGTAGYSGDGSSATTAKVNSPAGVSVDANGNVFVADTGNQSIRKITNNIIFTVAGNGVAGLSGNGGFATNANLSSPNAVISDKSGNLFIADSANNVIRAVATNGLITSMAGRSLNDGDLAVNATLNVPWGVVQDNAGNTFVSETGNHRIRKIDTNGVITTFAGNGIPAFGGDGGQATNASLKYPMGLALDSSGDLFIADEGNYRVRMVNTNGTITTVAGNGTGYNHGDGAAATNAGFYPFGLAMDLTGNLYIADMPHDRIRKVDTNGIITTVAGNNTFSYSGDGSLATNTGIGDSAGVAIDGLGNLYFASSSFYRICKVDTNGFITTVAGNGTRGDSGDGGLATNAQFEYPYCVSVDTRGDLFISDSISARVREVTASGFISTVAGNGIQGNPIDNVSGNGSSLSFPRGTWPDLAGNLFISDFGANRIRKVTFLQFGPTLSLTNVTTANAGSYQAVVTGANGSVTSSVVNLVVASSPLIYQTALNPDSSISLACLSQPGSTNIVFSAASLNPPIIWQPLSTNIANPDGTWQFTDTNAAGNQSLFYRSLMQ